MSDLAVKKGSTNDGPQLTFTSKVGTGGVSTAIGLSINNFRVGVEGDTPLWSGHGSSTVLSVGYDARIGTKKNFYAGFGFRWGLHHIGERVTRELPGGGGVTYLGEFIGTGGGGYGEVGWKGKYISVATGLSADHINPNNPDNKTGGEDPTKWNLYGAFSLRFPIESISFDGRPNLIMLESIGTHTTTGFYYLLLDSKVFDAQVGVEKIQVLDQNDTNLSGLYAALHANLDGLAAEALGASFQLGWGFASGAEKRTAYFPGGSVDQRPFEKGVNAWYLGIGPTLSLGNLSDNQALQNSRISFIVKRQELPVKYDVPANADPRGAKLHDVSFELQFSKGLRL